MEAADLVVINTCAIREGAEQKVIGRQGQLARLKAANPGMRVVLTGCSVREAGARRPAAGAIRPSTCSCARTRSRSSSTGSASPRRRARSVRAAPTTTVGRTRRRRRRRPVGDPRPGRGGGDRRPRLGDQRLAADHLRLRQDLHLLHRAVQPRSRSAAGRSTTSSTRPAPWPPPATARSRCSARTSTRTGTTCAPEPRFAHVDAERWAGRRLDLHGRPDLAELIRAIDGLRTPTAARRSRGCASSRRTRGTCRDRLIAALADCPSVCEHLHLPVQSGDDAVLRRMGRQYTIEHYQERLARIREAVPGITISTDVIVGFCGETEAQFQRTLAAARGGPLRPGLRRGLLAAARARRRPVSPTTCRPTSSARGSTSCSRVQEGIGLERNEAWLGREVEVLVDTVARHRHEHGHDSATERRARATAAVSGRTRGNKLVHLPGDADAGRPVRDRPHRARRAVCPAWRGRRPGDHDLWRRVDSPARARGYRSASTRHHGRGAGWG